MKEQPCATCLERKFYARRFDMHISGEDCPYVCEEYEKWKAEQKDGEDAKTLEEHFAEFGVKIGFLTPEKAEQLLKEHPRIARCKDCGHGEKVNSV